MICGHIHHAEMKTFDDIEYMNDGDWVESCTALVEHYDGRWEILYWADEIDNRNSKNSVKLLSSRTENKTHSEKEIT